MASSNHLSEANTAFCLDLFKELSSDNEAANVFFSPYSISLALAMVMLGAGGNTHMQMSKVLRFSEKEEPQPAGEQVQQQQVQRRVPPVLQQKLKPKDSQGDVHADFSQLLSEFNKPNAPYALNVANRLYGEKSYMFVQDFLKGTKKYYNAELETVDFKNSFETARVKINSWVKKQTQDKIQDILAEGALSDMTRLVLVNGIYFKGNWNRQFEERTTRDAEFRLNKRDTVTVKMMYQKSRFPLNKVDELNFQILELPYKGNKLSMLIFLPNDIEDDSTGLEKLERELTYENFMEWTRPDRMTEAKIEVYLPRFKMVEQYDMKNILTSLGMVDVFDTALSDLSGMSAADDLVMSKVIHKAFVEVNEKGTEAAAETAITIELTSFENNPIFKADRPFLFFIRHNQSKNVLFAGRFCAPE